MLAGGAAVVSARPVLGIICCTRAVADEEAQAVMNRYVVGALTFADCAGLLVPNLADLMTAKEVAPRLDGILLTGSPSNITADRYGHGDAEDAIGPYDVGRDAMTAGLIDAMIARGKPVFGICRGLQEINVAFGGTLRRDTSRNETLLRHHAPDEYAFDDWFDHKHDVALTAGGRLNSLYGVPRLRVNSVHYQGIDRLGAGLAIEATAPDGITEAVSATVNGAPVLAVQWHPEWRTAENPDSQVFFRTLGEALRAG